MTDDTPKRTTNGGKDDALDVIQFSRTTDREFTTRDKVAHWIDIHVYAPVMIAWNDLRARFGVAIILFFFLMGTVGVRITDPPDMNSAPVYVAPFPGGLSAPFDGDPGGWLEFTSTTLFGLSVPWFELNNVLGTSGFGVPLGLQAIHATPDMLKMIVGGAVFAVGLAAIVGTTSGYKGGHVDTVLMAITDIFLTVPGLPLIIVLAAVWSPESPWIVGILLAIDNWPGLARSIRSQVLTIRQESYIESSRMMGFSTASILRKDILPQLMPYVTINSAKTARAIIFESVALYFLGVLPYSSFNWGVMMNDARGSGMAMANLDHFYWLAVPMLTIMFFSLGLILFSQGMDRVFNVRLRARHAKTVDNVDD